MQLDHIAAIVTAAGAGPLAFVAFGLLVLTYLSARWFGSERTAVRVTVFAFLFLLICATPVLLWLSDRYRDATAHEPQPDSETMSNAAMPMPVPTTTPRQPRRSDRADGGPKPTPTFVEEVEPVRLPVSRFESSLRAKLFTVYFPLDHSDIIPSEAAFLDDVADEISRRNASQVMLAAHLDRWSGASYGVGLSQRLADAVKAYLTSRGVPAEAISTEAFGASRPAVATEDGVPDPRNRRVEIRFR